MPTRLLTPEDEQRLFGQLRQRISRTLLRQAFYDARLRSLVIVSLSVFFWVGMFVMFHQGFTLLNGMISHEGSRAQMVHAIYNVFYLTLLIMMTVSSAIILYSNLYRNREVDFLLTTPVRVKRIVWHKFQETLVFSGWGFVLMGSPLLIAYGVTSAAPWYYYVMLPPFVIGFLVIPSSLGALLCMVVVRFLPAFRQYLVGGLLVVGILAAAALGIAVVRTSSSAHLLTPHWFHETVTRMRFTEQRVLPSWWLSTGLLEAAHPQQRDGQQSWKESLGFLSALLSTSFLLYGIVGWCGQRTFVNGYNGLASMATRGKRRPHSRWDHALGFLLGFFPSRMRLLLLKDMKIFRRDPLQWLQVAIFVGLLTVYFLQLRRLYFQDALAKWIMMISYLNVSVIGLMLATFTTRFIYPLLSLEGRRIWILATMPVKRDAILWSKFLFGSGLSIVPCCGLVLLSDTMLRITQYSPTVVAIHVATTVMLCIGLSGIAVGLGARFPNLQENSPAKIAAGFGGTLTLVLSSLFILLTVAATAIPTYLWLHMRQIRGQDIRSGAAEALALNNAPLLLAGTCIMFVAGVGLTTLVMRSGMRWFRRLEI